MKGYEYIYKALYSTLTFLRCCGNRDSCQVIYDVIKRPPLLSKLFKYGNTVLNQNLKQKKGENEKKWYSLWEVYLHC